MRIVRRCVYKPEGSVLKTNGRSSLNANVVFFFVRTPVGHLTLLIDWSLGVKLVQWVNQFMTLKRECN